jgi:hypothetical protein
MMTAASHHNQVGIASGWVTQYMKDTGNERPPSEQDRVALFNTAGAYWTLRNAIVEVHAGVRTFEAAGRVVRLPYRGNREIDALDRTLDLLERMDSALGAPIMSNPRLRDWLGREGLAQPWSALPSWVLDAFREQAARVLAGYPRYLPPDARVAGIAVCDIDKLWVELLAWGMHMQIAIMLGSLHLPTIVPLVPRKDLIGALADASGLRAWIVDRVVGLLTLDLSRCKDGALTPLVPIDDYLVPMSSSIVCTSPQRNLLAILQSDPSTFGEAGRLLGLAGEHSTVELLQRLRSDIAVTRRVKVLRADGSPAGDLDVVACDPSTRRTVVFEIRWGIAADGNAECTVPSSWRLRSEHKSSDFADK